MLTLEQVRDVITPVLEKELGGYGFAGLSLRFADDHDGDPSIYVEVDFREGHKPLPQGLASIVGIRVIDALREKGENRFPYTTVRSRNPVLPTKVA